MARCSGPYHVGDARAGVRALFGRRQRQIFRRLGSNANRRVLDPPDHPGQIRHRLVLGLFQGAGVTGPQHRKHRTERDPAADGPDALREYVRSLREAVDAVVL